MNISDPLVPKSKAVRERKTGRTVPFRDDYWKEFDDVHSYERRKQMLSEQTNSLRKYQDDQQIYVDVQFDFSEVNNSKSSQPKDLWEQANLEIVAGTDDATITISGKQNSFLALQGLIATSDFATAKSVREKIPVKNISREIYAVASIADRTNAYTKRLDSRLLELLEAAASEEVLCSLEIYSNIPKSQTEQIQQKIEEVLGKEIFPYPEEQIIRNILFDCNLSPEEAKSLLTDEEFSYIQIIRVKGTFEWQRLIPNTNLGNVPLQQPITDEVIGLIDSGVNHTLLNPLLTNIEKHLPDAKYPEYVHGTTVLSRVVFGDGLFNQVRSGSLTPLCRYLDIQVLFEENGQTTYEEKLLRQAITEVFRRYPDVCVFNFSINHHQGTSPRDFDNPVDRFTEFLDEQARLYDKFVVVSSGNNPCYPSYTHNYAQLFTSSSDDIYIATPAEGLNVIAVGSITGIGGQDFICAEKGYPSPFSRRGLGRNGILKPEVVHVGGNVLKPSDGDFNRPSFVEASKNRAGVESISTNGLCKDFGSSLSAPLVSREAIIALDRINRGEQGEYLDLTNNRANLLKALVVHSTRLKEQLALTDEALAAAYGLGIPEVNLCFSDNEDQATIIYTDKIVGKDKKHKLHIKLPDNLVGKKCRFVMTVVYNPPVDSNFPHEYNSAFIKSNLRVLDNFPEEVDDEEFKPRIGSPKVKNQFFQINNEHSSIIQKVFEGKLSFPNLEFYSEITLRGRFERENPGIADIFEQSYATVITLIDLEGESELKEQMLQSEQFVQIEPETQVQV